MLDYKEALKNLNYSQVEFILAPSNIYLSLFKNTNFKLCTQDITLNEDLNLTGDITIKQLKSLNVSYTIIGHYERRKFYHETTYDILTKIKLALHNNLKVIYCIGETKEELERHVEYQVLEKELARVLNNIPTSSFKNLIIAYEPSYLIGTNDTCNIVKIKETINFIKKLIFDYYEEDIPVVYGGNININNIKAFTTISTLDGYIIGSSSLNPTNIGIILDNLTKC